MKPGRAGAGGFLEVVLMTVVASGSLTASVFWPAFSSGSSPTDSSTSCSSTSCSSTSCVSTSCVSTSFSSTSLAAPVFELPLEAIALSPSRLRRRSSPTLAGNSLDRSQTVVGRLCQSRGLGGQEHQRPGHQEHHNQVEDGGQAQRECESLDLADSQEVQHRGSQERHRVTRHDRLAGSRPPAWYGGSERPAFADLVFEAFEEDDKRVRGGTYTDDQTGNTGQVQGVVDISAQ